MDGYSAPVSSSSDIGISQGPDGLQVTDNRPPEVWARITGGAGAYSWVQVLETDPAFPDDPATGFRLSGTATDLPAREVNGYTGDLTDKKVRLRLDPSRTFYAFERPAGGGGGAVLLWEVTASAGAVHSIKQKVWNGSAVVDGTAPAVTGVISTTGGPIPVGTRVEYDAANGWCSPSPDYAASGKPGLVSHLAQTVSGEKTFESPVHVNSLAPATGGVKFEVKAHNGGSTVQAIAVTQDVTGSTATVAALADTVSLLGLTQSTLSGGGVGWNAPAGSTSVAFPSPSVGFSTPTGGGAFQGFTTGSGSGTLAGFACLSVTNSPTIFRAVGNVTNVSGGFTVPYQMAFPGGNVWSDGPFMTTEVDPSTGAATPLTGVSGTLIAQTPSGVTMFAKFVNGICVSIT